VLGQVLAIWGGDPADTFTLSREPLKQPAREGVQVAQIHHRLRERRPGGEEVPSIDAVASELVANEVRLENPPINQALSTVDNRDQDPRGLLLSQVACLGQNHSTNPNGY